MKIMQIGQDYFKYLGTHWWTVANTVPKGKTLCVKVDQSNCLWAISQLVGRAHQITNRTSLNQPSHVEVTVKVNGILPLAATQITQIGSNSPVVASMDVSPLVNSYLPEEDLKIPLPTLEALDPQTQHIEIEIQNHAAADQPVTEIKAGTNSPNTYYMLTNIPANCTVATIIITENNTSTTLTEVDVSPAQGQYTINRFTGRIDIGGTSIPTDKNYTINYTATAEPVFTETLVGTGNTETYHTLASPINTIQVTRDGTRLTKVESNPSADQFAVDKITGTVTLGTTVLSSNYEIKYTGSNDHEFQIALEIIMLKPMSATDLQALPPADQVFLNSDIFSEVGTK